MAPMPSGSLFPGSDAERTVAPGAAAVLEAGCIYVVELAESLKLPRGVSGVATPKSSTGRLDIFTRLLSERATEFETVQSGYVGPLYLEICPRSFSVVAHAGTRLNQL